MKDKYIKSGERFKGDKVTGSRVMYCPKCNVYLPHKFLVTNDMLGTQRIGYVCGSCENLLVEIKRRRDTGKIVSKYVDPGYKP